MPYDNKRLAGAPAETWQCVGMCVWMWVKPQRIDWERQRLSLAVTGGVLVICHWVRYPDKAIREKQILQPHGFSSPVLHSDELLKNGVQLKLVLYARLQICLLSGLLPPVFIDCNGLLINLPFLFFFFFCGGRQRRKGWPSHHVWCVWCTIPNKYACS